MALSIDNATKTSSVVFFVFFLCTDVELEVLRERQNQIYVCACCGAVSVMLALLIFVDVPAVLVTVISLGARLLPSLLCLLWLLRCLCFSCRLGICKRELASQSIR